MSSAVVTKGQRTGVLPCTVPLPTPDDMRAVLIADSWEPKRTRYPELIMYVKTVEGFDGRFELPMPEGTDLPDGYVSYVLGALRTLTGLEDKGRPIGDLAAEIIAGRAALAQETSHAE